MANVENELNDLEDDEKEILESRTPRRVFVTALFHSLFLAACLMTIPAGLTVVLFITSGSAFTSSIVVTIVALSVLFGILTRQFLRHEINGN